jgi:hypothetical protein
MGTLLHGEVERETKWFGGKRTIAKPPRHDFSGAGAGRRNGRVSPGYYTAGTGSFHKLPGSPRRGTDRIRHGNGAAV